MVQLAFIGSKCHTTIGMVDAADNIADTAVGNADTAIDIDCYWDWWHCWHCCAAVGLAKKATNHADTAAKTANTAANIANTADNIANAADNIANTVDAPITNTSYNVNSR